MATQAVKLKNKIYLSILCDGTFYNSDDKSIIGELEHAIDAHAVNKGGVYNPPVVTPVDTPVGTPGVASEQHYKIYVPGPGASPNKDYGRPGEINPVTGQAKSDNKKYQATKPNAELFQDAYGLHLPEVKSPVSILKALLTGTGLRDNVVHILDCVARLIADPNVDWANSEVTIQIAGWSRGAVLAGIIANMLTTSFIGPDAKVTVVQVDPVGGKINNKDFCEQQENQDCKGIGENVTEHLALLAMDEIRDEMSHLVQDDVLAEDPRRAVYQAIGIHGSHKSIACGDSPGAQITRHTLATKFLANGAKFLAGNDHFKPKTEVELIELYYQSKMQQQQYEYKLSPLKRLLFTRKQRQFLKTHDHAIRLPQYFVNSQHEALFAAKYQELYQFLLDPVVSKAELDKMKPMLKDKLIIDLRTHYQLQDMEEIKASETLLALGKCMSLLRNTQPAVSQQVQRHILQTFKQDYLLSHHEKAIISGLDIACSAYISQTAEEIAEIDQRLAKLSQASSNALADSEKAELIQSKTQLQQKSQSMMDMRNILNDNTLAEKNRLQLFEQEFKVKRSGFEQGSSPKLRLILDTIVERLAAVFKIFSSRVEEPKKQVASDPTLASMERHLAQGLKLRR